MKKKNANPDKKPGSKNILHTLAVTLFTILLFAIPTLLLANSYLKLAVPAATAPTEEAVAQEPLVSEATTSDITPAPAPELNMLFINAESQLANGYKPELETIVGTYQVDKRIAPDVRAMLSAAEQDGVNLVIVSAYRSLEKQETLYEQKVSEYKNGGKSDIEATEIASTIVATPGTSEHQVGLALDITTTVYTTLDSGFENTPAFAWLSENAHKYGFILRFQKGKEDITRTIYEPWHYRYVGIEHATAMKKTGELLEEYISGSYQKARETQLYG